MRLFSLFEDADMAESAARSLGRIPGLEGTVLLKKYHATIRVSDRIVRSKRVADFSRFIKALVCTETVQRHHAGD